MPWLARLPFPELFRVETIDWTGGQIKDNDDASDVKNVDLNCCHHLSGPIRVADSAGVAAKPGDLLVVEICDLGPLPGDEWGYTGTFDRNNGGGFLTDHFPCASKAIWQFDGVYASSRHIPGVRFAGIIHPGLSTYECDVHVLGAGTDAGSIAFSLSSRHRPQPGAAGHME